MRAASCPCLPCCCHHVRLSQCRSHKKGTHEFCCLVCVHTQPKHLARNTSKPTIACPKQPLRSLVSVYGHSQRGRDNSGKPQQSTQSLGPAARMLNGHQPSTSPRRSQPSWLGPASTLAAPGTMKRELQATQYEGLHRPLSTQRGREHNAT